MIPSVSPEMTVENLWREVRSAAETQARLEPAMRSTLVAYCLDRDNFQDALAYLIEQRLMTADRYLPIRDLIDEAHRSSPGILPSAIADLAAIAQRDPAQMGVLTIFLFFKGFVGLEAYRCAHWLWSRGRKTAAAAIQSRIAQTLGLDLHPGARIGKGIMMDHAQGIVIGETALIEDDVSILHNVTLGGTGIETGDRHPKIRRGVMIGAGATILGNIEIGANSRVAAGSVVLRAVPPRVTVAGVPARVIGDAGCALPSGSMDQMLPDIAASI